jgi:hypothetical protein
MCFSFTETTPPPGKQIFLVRGQAVDKARAAKVSEIESKIFIGIEMERFGKVRALKVGDERATSGTSFSLV